MSPMMSALSIPKFQQLRPNRVSFQPAASAHDRGRIAIRAGPARRLMCSPQLGVTARPEGAQVGGLGDSLRQDLQRSALMFSDDAP